MLNAAKTIPYAKVWMLVEAMTSYVYHCIPYRGQLFDRIPAGQQLSSYIVKSLLSDVELL